MCKTIRKNQKGVLQQPRCKIHHRNKLSKKTVKYSFTDKTLEDERIALAKNNKVVSVESKLEKLSAIILEVLFKT